MVNTSILLKKFMTENIGNTPNGDKIEGNISQKKWILDEPHSEKKREQVLTYEQTEDGLIVS